MPWFRNKETGLEWYIADKAHAERLARDPAYEEVPGPKPKRKRAQAEKAGGDAEQGELGEG